MRTPLVNLFRDTTKTLFLCNVKENVAEILLLFDNLSHHRVPIRMRRFHTSSDAYAKLVEKFAHDRALCSGRALHARLIINRLARLTHFACKLIPFYVECRHLRNARKLFDKIPKTNARRWIVLIGAQARHGFYQEALAVFCEMQKEGHRLNKFVLPSILKACGHLCCEDVGLKMHAVILRHSFVSDAFVQSALIDMYSKCGSVEKARRAFDATFEKDLVSLNAMVSGYTQHGFAKEAMGLVEKMQLIGIKPNVVTWNALIAGFSQAGDHCMVSDLLQLMQANGVEPDVVSWTSVISGLVQNFQFNEAFGSFKRMMDQGFCPSSVTISALLPACAGVANLRRGKEIHGYALVIGIEDDIYVRSALVDMYAKCGHIFDARRLFGKMSEKNTITCNSMIFGYANHGYCREAIELFDQMENGKEKPDDMTFIAALTACGHAGMVELGQNLFRAMQDKYGIIPRLEHYACMVDLVGRAGKLTDAYDLIMKMPIKPDLFVWGAFLGACRNHGNIELAEIAAHNLSALEPESASGSLLLTSLYADAGIWKNVTTLKKMMKKRKLQKNTGCSWIEAA